VHSPHVHLTLAFLGDVPAGRVIDAITAADAIGVPPFELKIDTRGYWRRNRIVWAGAAQCPPPLRDLAARLNGMLRAAGFQCETREYVPHITLLREACRAPLLQINGAIAWRAEDFVLVRSVHRDAVLVYEIVQRWPLKA